MLNSRSCDASQLMQVLTELPVMYFVLRNLDYSHRLAAIDVLGVVLGVWSKIQGTSQRNPVLSAASVKTVVWVCFFFSLSCWEEAQLCGQRISFPDSSVDSLKLSLLTAAIQLIVYLSDWIVASQKICAFIKMSNALISRGPDPLLIFLPSRHKCGENAMQILFLIW